MKPWAYPNQLLWISLPHFPPPNLQAFSLWLSFSGDVPVAAALRRAQAPSPRLPVISAVASLLLLPWPPVLPYSFLPYSLPVCRARSFLVYGRRVFSRDAEQIQIPTAGLLGVGWGVMSFPSPCLSLEPSAAQLSATFNGS